MTGPDLVSNLPGGFSGPLPHWVAPALAGLSMLAGVVLWVAGWRVARTAATLLLGLAAVGAALFISWSVGVRGSVLVVAGLTGAVTGAVLGRLTYRVLPGAVLAGLAFTGAWACMVLTPAGILAALESRGPEAPVTLSLAAAKGAALSLHATVTGAWAGVPTGERPARLLAACGLAVLTLLIGLCAPRIAAAVLTAGLGAALVLGAGLWLGERADLAAPPGITPVALLLVLGAAWALGSAAQIMLGRPGARPA